MLTLGLAVLGAPSVQAQTSPEEMRKLQEENAALRRQLEDMQRRFGETTPAATPAAEAPAAAPSSQGPRTAPAASARTERIGDEEVVVMSPFEVADETDKGYLRTNAVTATRIGTAIQDAPISVSVMSEDFIKDTGLRSITDILRYTASGSPDTGFMMRRPANEATPQGNFTMRGFKVNSLMRNGVFRYTSYNLDNIERVEIVKGPAAVFFGQGYPGGVINYITKEARFQDIPSTFSFYFDSEGSQGVSLDQNTMFSDSAAFRIVGAWHDDEFERDGEYYKGYNFTPSFAFVPFESQKVRINLSLEHLREKFNRNDFAWIYPEQWYADYSNPSAALIAAADLSGSADPLSAYRARILNSPANWMSDVRKVAGDPLLPLYRAGDVRPGARYDDASGNKIYDENFNYTSRGAYSENVVTTVQARVELAPTDWMDVRYVYTHDNDRYDAVEGRSVPNADLTYNTLSGGNTAGYYRRAEDHQLDVIFRADLFNIKNKFLLGGVHNRYFQQYNANSSNNVPIYWQIPGYNYPDVNVDQTQFPGNWGRDWNVPVNQVIRDRNGVIKTPAEIYTRWDPGYEIRPPIDKVFPLDRNLLDGYKPKNHAWYANWQAEMLDSKLTLLLGYRKESSESTGQHLTANYPWFIVPPNAWEHPDLYPPDVYNYAPSYARTNFDKRSGDSWMIGASYALTDEISVYATASKTFKLNFGNVGGFYEQDLPLLLQDALDHGNGSFGYLGSTITSVQQGLDVVAARGAYANITNEEGINYEVGVKTQLWDSKLVSTVSLFRGERSDEKLDDAQMINTDPFNYSTTLFDSTSAFYNVRNFRWRTTGITNRIEGLEFETIYTHNQNLQAIINGSWLWTAKTVTHPSYTRGDGGIGDIYLGNRIENVPEFRFNTWTRYTFTDTALRGMSVALGFRYSAETVVSRSVDWNPNRGGFQAGDYLVFDGNVSYPWRVGDYAFTSSLMLNNITDETYYEGNYIASQGFNWRLTTTLRF